MAVKLRGVPLKDVRIDVAGQYGNRHLEGTKKLRGHCSAANGM